MTLGIEDDQQLSSIGTPFDAISQAWIDVEHREMTLLVGKEKVKFNIHQSIQLTDEEKMMCMRIESLFLHFDPRSFKRKLLKDINLKPTPSPPKSWHLSLHLLFQR